MTITKIIREKKPQIKMAAIVVAVVLLLVLFVGSWRANIRLANKNLDVSWGAVSTILEKRQVLLAELLQYIQQKAPQEKKLQEVLGQSYQSLEGAPFNKQILWDFPRNQAFVATQLATSELTQQVAQYSWQKTALAGDMQYHKRLKALHFNREQIRSSQRLLNENIVFYNRTLRGLSGFALNTLFRYPSRLKLEAMVGEWSSFDNFIGETQKPE